MGRAWKLSWRRGVADVLYWAVGAGVSLGLLFYLHREWQPRWAVLCGGLSGILLRRALASAHAGFPRFLRRPIDGAVVLLGALLATAATSGVHGWTFLLDRWREVAALVIASALVGVGLTALVYTHRRMALEIEQARAREAALRESALRAQLAVLQAQINPHFLFNALNALAELTHEDPDVAEALVNDLAHLLRYSLRSSAVGMVPLSQELEAVDRYLRIERARFGDRLRVEVHADPTLSDTLVPGLLLQPLVENAVVHGVAPRSGGGTVRVRVSAQDGGVAVTVEDDGPGVPEDVRRRLAAPTGADQHIEVGTAGAGGGLANVQQRVALAYRGSARFTVEPSDSGGARMKLWVPRREAST